MPRGKERRWGSSFCLRHRPGFHFESSITVGDQSQLNSSCEDARSEKNKKRRRRRKEGKEKAKTFRIGWVSNDFKHPPLWIIDRWRRKFFFDLLTIFLIDNKPCTPLWMILDGRKGKRRRRLFESDGCLMILNTPLTSLDGPSLIDGGGNSSSIS